MKFNLKLVLQYYITYKKLAQLIWFVSDMVRIFLLDSFLYFELHSSVPVPTT